jgi:serine/threonine-protein kinase/endoribonuclease IRE1
MIPLVCAARESGADAEISLLIHSDAHEAVLRYFAKEEDEDFIYLALERCEHSLDDAFEKPAALQERYSDETLQRILATLLSGLAYLHSLNIVHRDLKPQNVLLTDRLHCKIADMGLGKKLDTHRSSFDSLVAGTVGWP